MTPSQTKSVLSLLSNPALDRTPATLSRSKLTETKTSPGGQATPARLRDSRFRRCVGSMSSSKTRVPRTRSLNR